MGSGGLSHSGTIRHIIGVNVKIQKLLVEALEISSLQFVSLLFWPWRIFIKNKGNVRPRFAAKSAAKEGKKGWNITLMQLQPFDMEPAKKIKPPSRPTMLNAQYGPD